MVINLRVKTLDSQDHEFSVEDDISVRQLKERIHEKTNIAIDQQRLIYCGRVMNDDNPLKDYNVNDKVIHLVQRLPPGSAPRVASGNSSEPTNERRRNTESGRNNMPGFFHVLDGSVMGALAIPMNSGATQTITHSMNPSSTLCMNRITVARHMLNCANNIANYLENPERGLNNTDMDILAQQTMESTVFEVGISAVDSDVPQQEVQNVVQLFQGAVSAALQQNGLPNITVDAVNGSAQPAIPFVFGSSGGSPTIEMNTSSGGSPTVRVLGVSQGPVITTTGSPSTSSASESSPSSSSSSQSRSSGSGDSAASNSTTSGESQSSSSSQQTTSPRVLAEVVQQMRSVQGRMEPFVQQYYDILQNEPKFEENDTTGRENAQRVFDRVSEALHYFSHAQHAISDLMLDLSANTPRHLCCRPILVEQSAYVSSGFAIPNIIQQLPGGRADTNGNNNLTNNNNVNNNNLNNNNNNPSNNNTNNNINTNNNNNEAAANNNVSQNASNGVNTLGSASATATATASASAPATATATSTSPNQNRLVNEALAQSLRSASQFPVARLIQAVMESVPGNADIHFEINQNAVMDGQPGAVTSQNEQQQSTSSTETTSTNSESGGNSFRASSATHPTTSTQTRSTARPSIPVGQIRSLRPNNAQLSSFDRYLPCNSHHIRDPENPQQQSQQQSQSQSSQQTPQQQPQQQQQLQQQQQQRPQQPPQPPQRSPANPRSARITIATPHVHIQRGVPNSVRFANFLTNHLQNRFDRTSSTAGSSRTQPSSEESGPTSILVTGGVPLNDTQLSTLLPVFGSAQVQLQIRDLVHVSPTPSALNRIRSNLRDFLITELSLSTTVCELNVTAVVNQVITLLNPFILLLPELAIPDYDARGSVENLIRRTLPFIINLIRDDESAEFGTRLLREISVFTKRFIVVLLHSLGRPGAQEYLKNIVEAIFTSTLSDVGVDGESSRFAIQWFRRHTHDEILRRFQDIRLDSTDVLEFLVIRRPAPPTMEQAIDAMETDSNDTMASGSGNETTEDADLLPAISFGSENWHGNFPTPWLPIITRDISRQRRQSPQRPLSDAYISGMSSKRRKLINNAKPATAEPNNILPQSVHQVLQSRITSNGGAASSSSSSSTSSASNSNITPLLDEAIATNQHIQEPHGSYEQALLNHVQNRITSDPTFSPERFPNCSKWINKNN